MNGDDGQKGIALVLAMLAAVIFAGLTMAVYAGLRTQGNLSAMLQGSKEALTRAEDGLTLAVVQFKQDPSKLDQDLEVVLTEAGWQVTVGYQAATGELRSVASKGRFRRGIAATYQYIVNPLLELNYAACAFGSIYFNGSGTYNMKTKPMFAGNGYLMGEEIPSFDNAVLLAPTGKSLPEPAALGKNPNQLLTGVAGDALEYPSDAVLRQMFQGLCNAADLVAGAENFQNTLQNSANHGKLIVIEVDRPIVSWINSSIEVAADTTVVFVKASGYSGDYVVQFKDVSNFNCEASLNLLVDGGAVSFENINYNNEKGVIFANHDGYAFDESHLQGGILVNNGSMSFQTASMVSKGNIYFEGSTFDYHADPAGNPWETSFEQFPGGLKGWHEI